MTPSSSNSEAIFSFIFLFAGVMADCVPNEIMAIHFDDTDDYKKLVEYMDAVEGNGPQTTLFALLNDAGIQMPAPDALSDSELTTLLEGY